MGDNSADRLTSEQKRENTRTDDISSGHNNDNNEAKAYQEKLSDWLLFRGTGDNEMIHYVKNTGDEESFVYIDGFTSFFLKDNKDMPQGGISYVGGISQDGKKILLMNLSHQKPSISAQIYNFLSHQTELQFQLPHEDYALSPDLNQYLFEENRDIYLFRAKENEKTKLPLAKRDMYSRMEIFP